MNEQNDKSHSLEQIFEGYGGQKVTYQFQCSQCGHITESKFLFGEPPSSVSCENPECSGVAKKIISTPGVLVGIPTHPARKNRGRGY